MDARSPNNSEIVSNIRNMSISRRGGVRTRGGRLPPVNLREITQITSGKKVITPKIPQRRKNIMKEVDVDIKPLIKKEGTDLTPSLRGRGRGRQQKVFLQTGGSFLAEGPAAKMKRDTIYGDTFSMPRASRKSANEDKEVKVDPDTIKYLLRDYDADEAYEDDIETKAPYRLPFLKKKAIGKIKMEPEDDEGIKIKQEPQDDEGIKIKQEPQDEIKAEVKKEIKIKKEDNFLNEMKMHSKTAEDFQSVKDNGMLILLQLPQLSVSVAEESSEKKSNDKTSKKDDERKMTSKFIDNFEEGLIGKLQLMKSGKIRVLLNDVVFELDDAVSSESYLEAVSIRVDKDEGDMVVLGKIEKKLILSSVVSSIEKSKETCGRAE